MKRVPVSSSNVASVGYDPDTSTLEVEFLGGGVYVYANVAPSVHDDMMKAKSVGGYFHARVKGKYDFQKAGAEK